MGTDKRVGSGKQEPCLSHCGNTHNSTASVPTPALGTAQWHQGQSHCCAAATTVLTQTLCPHETPRPGPAGGSLSLQVCLLQGPRVSGASQDCPPLTGFFTEHNVKFQRGHTAVCHGGQCGEKEPAGGGGPSTGVPTSRGSPGGAQRLSFRSEEKRQVNLRPMCESRDFRRGVSGAHASS